MKKDPNFVFLDCYSTVITTVGNMHKAVLKIMNKKHIYNACVLEIIASHNK